MSRGFYFVCLSCLVTSFPDVPLWEDLSDMRKENNGKVQCNLVFIMTQSTGFYCVMIRIINACGVEQTFWLTWLKLLVEIKWKWLCVCIVPDLFQMHYVRAEDITQDSIHKNVNRGGSMISRWAGGGANSVGSGALMYDAGIFW